MQRVEVIDLASKLRPASGWGSSTEMRHLTSHTMNIDEWMFSRRPITTCALLKTWLSQGSQIWPHCDITRRQRPMRSFCVVYIT